MKSMGLMMRLCRGTLKCPTTLQCLFAAGIVLGGFATPGKLTRWFQNLYIFTSMQVKKAISNKKSRQKASILKTS